jgi:hypothetical protein
MLISRVCKHINSQPRLGAQVTHGGDELRKASPCPLCFHLIAARELRLARLHRIVPPKVRSSYTVLHCVCVLRVYDLSISWMLYYAVSQAARTLFASFLVIIRLQPGSVADITRRFKSHISTHGDTAAWFQKRSLSRLVSGRRGGNLPAAPAVADVHHSPGHW